MSDLKEIAALAPDYIEVLVSDMLADNADDNVILLGSVTDDCGRGTMQVQLVVTRNPHDFMDE